MKKAMPFVQMIREKMEVDGVKALNLSLEFSEFDVLSLPESKEYLCNTIDVSIYLKLNYSVNSIHRK